MANRWREFLSMLGEQEADLDLHPTKDERYTLVYIQREAVLLLRYIKRGKQHIFCDMKVHVAEMDDRILRRWGLR